MDRSISLFVSFLAPSLVSLSASSLPLFWLCPFIHLKRVGAALRWRWQAAALKSSLLWMLIHPASSHDARCLVKLSIMYLKLDTISRGLVGGAVCRVITMATISPA
jgi:hypothetical protein